MPDQPMAAENPIETPTSADGQAPLENASPQSGGESPVLPNEIPVQFIIREEIESLNQIEDKYYTNCYPNLKRLLDDISSLVRKTIEKRCKNDLAKVFMTNFLCKCTEIINKYKHEYRAAWIRYYQIKLFNNEAQNCMVGGGNPNVWYNHFDESTKRQYFDIQDYKVKYQGKENEVFD